MQRTKTKTAQEVSEAASALGRIRTAKKAASSKANLKKANAVLTADQRHERAKKAAAASAKVRHEKALQKRREAAGRTGRKVD